MSDSSFGGDTAGLGQQIPQDQGGGKTGGMPFDPNSMMGGWGDPFYQAQAAATPADTLYQAQAATTPTNAPTDPQTGAAVSPGAGQPSGQSGGWVSQLVSALNPFSMSGAQARPQQPAAPGQPPAAPGWMQPNQGQMFTQGGDPSTWGGESAAAGSYGTPPPARRQNAPAASPAPAQAPSVPLPRPRPAAADAAPAAADTPPAADPYYDPGGAFGLGPERAAGGGTPGATYDPSTDPFAAATGMTAPAGGGTGDLPIPAGPPGTFADKILGPSPAQAALPPKDQSKPPAPDVGDPLTTPTTDPSAVVPMETGVSGAERGAGAPSQAPASTTGDTTTPPSAAPTAGAGPSGGGQAGQPQINPMRLLTDLLFGGPQRLMQDLMSMARQSQMPGYGQQADGQQGQQGQRQGAAAPWLAQGQRAPRGTDPRNYPQATPEQARAIQQRQAVPGIDAQGRPQTSQTNQPNQPRPVTTQRVTPSSGSPNLPGATPTSATMPSTGSGNLDPFTQAAAGGTPANSSTPPEQVPQQIRPRNLVQDRAPYRQQVDANPQLREKIMRIMYNEQGANPEGVQAIAESLLNRASARGTSLEQQARWHGTERGGYYARGNMGRGALENPRVRAILEQGLNNALAGSNISNYATDNSSGGLASRERASGAFRYASGYGGETFFTPARAEPGLAHRYQQWLAQIQNDGGGNLARIRNAQASGRQGLVQAIPGQPAVDPAEQLANAAYDRMPPRYGSRRNRREWENFRRSGDIEDRRSENPSNEIARLWSEDQNDAARTAAFGRTRGPRPERRRPTDPMDPMAEALGLNDLYRGGPRRTAGQ